MNRVIFDSGSAVITVEIGGYSGRISYDVAKQMMVDGGTVALADDSVKRVDDPFNTTFCSIEEWLRIEERMRKRLSSQL